MYQTKRYEKEITVKAYLAQYVNIEEFLEYCKACKNYDRLWSCPSYDFEQEAYWKQYEKLYILGYQIFFEEGTTEAESLRIMAEVKARMSEELFAMEAAYPGSVSLSAGSCSVCGEENCTRPQGEPCRYPDKLRYSIESIGGNVGKTVHDFWESRSSGSKRARCRAILCWSAACSNRRLALRSDGGRKPMDCAKRKPRRKISP